MRYWPYYLESQWEHFVSRESAVKRNWAAFSRALTYMVHEEHFNCTLWCCVNLAALLITCEHVANHNIIFSWKVAVVCKWFAFTVRMMIMSSLLIMEFHYNDEALTFSRVFVAYEESNLVIHQILLGLDAVWMCYTNNIFLTVETIYLLALPGMSITFKL